MKKHKKSIVILIVVILIFIILGISKNHEKNITRFVKANQEELMEISEKCLNYENDKKYYKKVQVDGVFTGEHLIVQYYYSGVGLAPSTKYYGFYYSPDNEPTAFQNVNIPLSKTSDNEWKWSDGTDNGGITKKIYDNWFYYEAWF